MHYICHYIPKEQCSCFVQLSVNLGTALVVTPVEAVLWIARTGSPWRDLPSMFGKWNTVFKRFRDWVKADVFKRLFDAVSDEPDMEYAMVDATIVKVHRHGQGAKGGLRARLSANPKAA
jgi:transposase